MLMIERRGDRKHNINMMNGRTAMPGKNKIGKIVEV